MPQEMRGHLRKAAKRGGKTEGQELLTRLNRTFAQEHRQERDRAMRAITFCIEEVAEHANYWHPGHWHSDPYLFAAFKLAVGKLLDALTPAGKIVTPPL